MSKIHVVTDSAASLPADILAQYPISIVPVSVQIAGKTYREGIDITKEELYAHLAKGEIPTTSQPAPGDYIEIYKPLAEEGKSIISVHITGKASGTCECARLAGEMLPEADVTVFDSLSAGMGTGLLAIEAARLAAAGKDKPAILAHLKTVRQALSIFIAVPTLKYLQKSGRVGLSQALIGSLLQIKPILGIEDGVVKVVEKGRTWQNTVKKIQLLAKELAADQPVVLAVQHAQDEAAGQALLSALKKEIKTTRSYLCEMSSSLAVHGGPGMLAVVLFQEQAE